MNDLFPVVSAFGDSAVIVVFGCRVDPDLNDRALRFARELSGLRSEQGWGAVIPAFASALIQFDPDVIQPDDAIARIQDMVAFPNAAADVDRAYIPVEPIEIPVAYGGDFGPDLTLVAELCGMTVTDVIRIHSSRSYRVYMLGFAPGFGYLGGLPTSLRVPRRREPRMRVENGSIGIGGEQVGVYALASPGGLQIIGRTSLELWNLERPTPSLLLPGMEVRFVPEE